MPAGVAQGGGAALASTDQPTDALLPDTGVGLERERRLAPVFLCGADYGTRCGILLWVNENGEGCITERRFGPEGVAQGKTQLRFRWRIGIDRMQASMPFMDAALC